MVRTIINLKIVEVTMLVVYTASKMWSLGRFLPMIIGVKVPEGCIYWAHYLQFLTIIEYIFSPVVYPDTPAYLQVS